MNQKELGELRRRLRSDKCGISRIYTCYVGSNRDIISTSELSLGMMQEEESAMYLNLLRKSLSGSLGKNLTDIVFSTKQVADSDEHRLLQTLRQTSLQDAAAREVLYRKIIDALELEDSNYLILLAADTYDVPHRGRDGLRDDDASDQIFQYFLCSICPVKEPKLALRYELDEKSFRAGSTGYLSGSTILGFLFPAFDSRAANIYNALYYSKSTKEQHPELIEALFHVEPPMSPAEQRETFDTALSTALEQSCSYDVVQSVHEELRARLEEHKESKDPEPLALSIPEMGSVLTSSGAPAEKVAAFEAECERQYGKNTVLSPENIIETKKFEIKTPEIRISASPENSALIETRVLGGRRYLLIPAEDGVEINGIEVTIPKPVVED